MDNQERREEPNTIRGAIADLINYLNESRASRPSREELLDAIRKLVPARRVSYVTP